MGVAALTGRGFLLADAVEVAVGEDLVDEREAARILEVLPWEEVGGEEEEAGAPAAVDADCGMVVVVGP